MKNFIRLGFMTAALFLSSNASAQNVQTPKPSAPYFKSIIYYGDRVSSVEPELKFKSIQILKEKGEEGLVEFFKSSPTAERQSYLKELTDSLLLESAFNLSDLEKSSFWINPKDHWQLGVTDYHLASRIRINEMVARGLAGLAKAQLIDSTSIQIIPILIKALDHPSSEVGLYAYRALSDLTLHDFGELFWERSMGAINTVAEHDKVSSAWQNWWSENQNRYPIFDRAIEDHCLNTAQKFVENFKELAQGPPLRNELAYLERFDPEKYRGTCRWDKSFIVRLKASTMESFASDELNFSIFFLDRDPDQEKNSSYYETFENLNLGVRLQIDPKTFKKDNEIVNGIIAAAKNSLTELSELNHAMAVQK